MAKRSPILGYNHNVRYRGLVFHVQTEDSGVMSPHLFTHLFHGGVIVSTRKLVYDAGSGEESIKSLMQAQHKAVLKDLRRHKFDDKIDEYLGTTPGLLPREAAEEDLTDDAIEEATPPPLPPSAASSSSKIPTQRPIPTPPSLPAFKPPTVPPPAMPFGSPAIDRVPSPSQVRFRKTPADDATIPDVGGAVAEAMAMGAATIPTAMPAMARAPTPPRVSAPSRTSGGAVQRPSLDDDEARGRSPRDTAVEPMMLDDNTRPTSASDGIPRAASDPAQPGVPGELRNRPATADQSRPNAALAAGALPAARPVTRPPSRPAIVAPTVMSRPLPAEERRRPESDAIEVYAPAPAGVDPPPGERTERPGQYSVRKGGASADVPMRERTGRISALPSNRVPTGGATSDSSGARVAAPVAKEPSAEIKATRAPTPSRVAPHATTPIASRTGTGQGAPGSGGVVMTRPAVIVGAPQRPSQPPRVRKAREDEGRGFGQGLISEKSLDEVILAYLSEDAEEK